MAMGEERPFLPDPNPEGVVPSHTPKKGKTVALWVVLVLALLPIWLALGDDGTPAAVESGATAADVCHPSPWFWFAQVGIPAVLVFGVLTWLVRLFGEFPRFHVTQEPGLVALSEGRFADAYCLFESTAKAVQKKPGYLAAVQLNMAESLLWSGRTQEALQIDVAIETTKRLQFAQAIRLQACAHLGVIYAILDDTRTAEIWANEVRQRLAKSGGVRYFAAASLCWAEALILCRKGRDEGCVALLDRERDHLRAWLTFRTLQSANLLRIFAAVRIGVAIENAIRQSCLRPSRRAIAEARVLFVSWPEMLAFLDTCPNDAAE